MIARIRMQTFTGKIRKLSLSEHFLANAKAEPHVASDFGNTEQPLSRVLAWFGAFSCTIGILVAADAFQYIEC